MDKDKKKQDLEEYQTAELDYDSDASDRVFGDENLEEKKLPENNLEEAEKEVVLELKPNLLDAPIKGLAPINVSSEMKNSFLEYAMSVIVSRAIPDAKDGLKPVHRRILYGMSEIGLSHTSAHKKSARIVGDVLGKYHPHGDSSVYEAMVRLAQDFSMRYPLIDGHGNFGSIDGDSAAAMRYTEARLARISQYMLEGIKKDAVPFIDNYDGSEREPLVLPALFPNLLVSGAKGIAVGMATEIPPHNLKEAIQAAIAYAHNEDISVEELMKYIPGPDFPTGGYILGNQGIIDAYETGNGSITMRAKTEIVHFENGKSRIIITEIPYAVLKTKIIEDISKAVKNKSDRADSIADIRDESSSKGMRLIIEVKRNHPPDILLNSLFRITRLQTKFSVNMVALVDGVPETLNLKRALAVYLEHQKTTTANVLQFDLEKAQSRLHILEGRKIAVNNIDEVIKIIRNTETDALSRQALEKRFNISEIQSKSIVEMPLGRINALSIRKLDEEISDIQVFCEHTERLLNNPHELLESIIEKMRELANKFGDARRTVIYPFASSNIHDADLIPQENIVITRSRKGYVKRLKLIDYKSQKRGGKGSRSAKTYDDDDVSDILVTTTHTDLLIFTSFGKVYRLKAYEIPESSKLSKGTPFNNFIEVEKGENIVSWLTTNSYEEDEYLLTVSTKGLVKRSLLSMFSNINKNGKRALTLQDGDELFRAMVVKTEEELILGSNEGQVVRFDISDIRPSGRSAMGVRGIKLSAEGKVTAVSSSSEGDLIFSLGAKGYGKKTSASAYRKTRRGAKGVQGINVSKAGALVYAGFVKGTEEVIIINSKGISIRTSLEEVSLTNTRAAKGVKVIRLDDKVTIKSVGILKLKEVEEQISKTQELELENSQKEPI